MFDIGWSELVVIAVVALIAIGPKELPGVLRMVGQWMGKARKMASEFQGQFNEAMREAEMADVKKAFDDVKEAASGFSKNNIMTALTKDVSDAMTIDKIENIDTPVTTPTTPEPPTPETFVEAETQNAQMEPLAITREVQPAPPEAPAAANDVAAAPEVAKPDVLKDAKAS
ncbi:MAG: twin-arginine translocation protein TatB [Tardiphaga sp.]|nr:twin-arginine translocation protein TatB [Tardiphaga sp.]